MVNLLKFLWSLLLYLVVNYPPSHTISWKIWISISYYLKTFKVSKIHTNNQDYDGCEVPTRPSFFESDLSCFWIGPSLFWLRPSIFRVTPSHFLSHSLLLFKWVLRTFPYQSYSFFELDLLIFLGHFFLFWKSVLLIFESDLPILELDLFVFLGQSFSLFWIRPSHFWSQTFPVFWVSPSIFFESDLSIFWVRPTISFGSVLPTFLSQTFPFLGCQSFPVFLSLIFQFYSANFYLIILLRVHPSVHVFDKKMSDLICQQKVYFSVKRLVYRR